MVQGDPEGLKAGLIGRAVSKGDILVLGGVRKKSRGMGGFGDMEDIDDIFNEFFGNMGGKTH